MDRTVSKHFIGLELCFYSLFILLCYPPAHPRGLNIVSPSALAIKVVIESTWD